MGAVRKSHRYTVHGASEGVSLSRLAPPASSKTDWMVIFIGCMKMDLCFICTKRARVGHQVYHYNTRVRVYYLLWSTVMSCSCVAAMQGIRLARCRMPSNMIFWRSTSRRFFCQAKKLGQ